MVLVCDASNKAISFPCLLLACCRQLPHSRRRTVLAGHHIAKRPCGQRNYAEALSRNDIKAIVFTGKSPK